jgi:hypothetical protein
MYSYLDPCGDPEDLSVDTIEYDEEYEVEKREEKHEELGYELTRNGMSFSIWILYG